MSKSSSAASQSHEPFVMDLQKIREQARRHMSDGPVTQSYGADRQVVLKLLNDALGEPGTSSRYPGRQTAPF